MSGMNRKLASSWAAAFLWGTGAFVVLLPLVYLICRLAGLR